jgi:hypothetical protein
MGLMLLRVAGSILSGMHQRRQTRIGDQALLVLTGLGSDDGTDEVVIDLQRGLSRDYPTPIRRFGEARHKKKL